MATQEKYQGWVNWETWNVALWVANERGLYDAVREHPEKFTAASAKALTKEQMTDGTPDFKSARSYSKVDWKEIADDFNEMRGDGVSETRGAWHPRVRATGSHPMARSHTVHGRIPAGRRAPPIEAKIDGHSLVIKATKEGCEELADAYASGGYPAAENVLHEALHEEFVFVDPAWIGAMTDAPILVPQDGVDFPDDADHWEVLPNARVFWFPNYMVEDPWETLREKGVVRFPEATEPSVAKERPSAMRAPLGRSRPMPPSLREHPYPPSPRRPAARPTRPLPRRR